MTANQFNRALKALGFAREIRTGLWSKGRTEFADKLGLQVGTVRRWANGQWPVPTYIAVLIRLMIKTRTPADDLPQP